MANTGAFLDRDWSRGVVVAGVLLVAGLGLAGVGAVVHFVAAIRVRSGECGACSLFLWHPLFVGLPLLVGGVSVVIAGYLLYRRRERPLA